MILDAGYCSVYSVGNIAPPGGMPKEGLVLKHQSYYGELDFETAPIYATPGQEDVEISARVRIHQNRGISNHDIAILSTELPPPDGALQYEITRAYHGRDPDNGQPITDLTLKKVVQQYDLE
jgi:hypothetical protein